MMRTKTPAAAGVLETYFLGVFGLAAGLALVAVFGLGLTAFSAAGFLTLAFFVFFGVASALAFFALNFSTRPAVSKSFSWPV
mgnify:CR=1 FL=1